MYSGLASQVQRLAKSSLSILEYLCSVSVNALDTYIIGLDSCSKTAPSPFLEASH